MSTDATSTKKPASSAGGTVTPTSVPTVDKGKEKSKVGKAEEVEDEDDEDDEESDDYDEDMEEDDDDEEFDAIDPTAIVGRRTRGAKVDYTSPEALSKAGLKPEDLDEDGEDSFAQDKDAMKD